MGQLDGKVALITGAARGQGAEEARLFLHEGARVVIADILQEQGRALAAELGENASYVTLDVGDAESWRLGIAHVLEVFGRLDILINNAGLFRTGPIAEFSAETFMELVRVNQLGVFLGMQAALPALKRQGGAIVNISSTAGLRGTANTAAYSATKFAVRAMTKVAALEFAPWNIRVNSVHPGLIETEMVSGIGARREHLIATTPLQRAGNVQDVARMVLFLVSEASAFSTGCEFVCDGGSTTGPAVGPVQPNG